MRPARLISQPADPLDAVDEMAKMAEDGGLIAGACADFQHGMVRFEPQALAHESDDIRLRDGLAAADGHGLIGISLGFEFVRHKGMPWHDPHGVQHTAIVDCRASPAVRRPCASASAHTPVYLAFRLPYVLRQGRVKASTKSKCGQIISGGGDPRASRAGRRYRCGKRQ